MSSSKKTCEETLRQVFTCLRPPPLLCPPPYTLYTCVLYTYSHREEGEVGEMNQIET